MRALGDAETEGRCSTKRGVRMSAKVFNRRARDLVSHGPGAVLLSMVAVFSLVAAVGGAGLLFDADWVWGTDFVTITDCERCDDGAVSLYWLIPGHRAGPITYQLGRHSLNRGRSAVQTLWPQIEPVCVASQPGGNRLFVGANDGAIYSVSGRQLDAPPELLGRHPGRDLVGLACTVDGRHLLSLSADSLCAWNLESKTLAWRRGGGAVRCFDVRSDSHSVVCGRQDGHIEEIEIDSGSTVRSVAGPSWRFLRLRLSPDGRMIVCVGGGGELHLLHWPTATPVWHNPSFRGHMVAAGFALFSPCGKLLITPGEEDFRTMAIWSVSTGQRVGELRGHTKPILGAAFSDDGRLASWGSDGTIRTWDVQQRTALSSTSLSVSERSMGDRLLTAIYDLRRLVGESTG